MEPGDGSISAYGPSIISYHFERIEIQRVGVHPVSTIVF
jgi:hypothetical protein